MSVTRISVILKASLILAFTAVARAEEPDPGIIEDARMIIILSILCGQKPNKSQCIGCCAAECEKSFTGLALKTCSESCLLVCNDLPNQ